LGKTVYAVVKPLFTPVVMVALLTEVAIGQTFFELRNIAFNRVNAPVLDASGVPLASTNYLAELWDRETLLHSRRRENSSIFNEYSHQL